jgi:hypothetical protein
MPQHYLTPLLLAVVGGITAWFVSHDVASTIGVAIGGVIAGVVIEKRNAAGGQ